MKIVKKNKKQDKNGDLQTAIFGLAPNSGNIQSGNQEQVFHRFPRGI
jgi:hypothetical protein